MSFREKFNWIIVAVTALVLTGLGLWYVRTAGNGAAIVARLDEFAGRHAHTAAGIAARAGGPVGDRLAAPETDPPQRFVQLVRIFAAQFSEHLPFALARQVRTRRWAGHEKAREANRCGHFGLRPSKG